MKVSTQETLYYTTTITAITLFGFYGAGMSLGWSIGCGLFGATLLRIVE